MRHANYKYLQDIGELNKQYHPWDKTNEIVGCGEYVSKMSDLILHDNPTTIKNILAPKKETQLILHLITCSRLDKAKGWDRMLILAQMLRDANIKFDWKIFTNEPKKCEYEEIHFYKQRLEVFDYVADSTYCVLLSDSEGLSYQIQEALQYQVPCIVTDVGGNVELIKDGINGYVVPLNMEFDVTKLLKIPICQEYDNHALENWLEYLGNGIYIEKGEIKEMKFKVKATNEYANTNRQDAELGFIPEEGYEWEVTKQRLDILLGKNFMHKVFVELIGEVKEEDPKQEPKEEIKKEVKKPRKTTKKKQGE